MILNETVAAIADAIREKTGKSDLIAPVNFAEEIKGITAGGGESGVRSSWRYFDVSKAEDGTIDQGFMPNIVRVADSNEVYPAVFMVGRWSEVTAVGVDGDGIVAASDGTVITWNETLTMGGLTPEVMAQMNVVEITEDEFLNKTFE